MSNDAPETMTFDGLPQKVRRLIEAAIGQPAHTDAQLRRDLYARAVALSLGTESVEPPDDIKEYSDKVALWAYKVLDEEVEGLRDADYTDDQIFELTICSALGAGAARFESGLKALEEALKHED